MSNVQKETLNVKVELSVSEWEVVLGALSEKPYKQVKNIIESVLDQNVKVLKEMEQKSKDEPKENVKELTPAE